MTDDVPTTASDRGRATQLTIPAGGITATSVQVDYSTLSGNRPRTYGNSVAVYQAGPDLPSNGAPLMVQPAPDDAEAGSLTFTDLQIRSTSYLVAYAVGNDAGTAFSAANVCATTFIPAGADATGDHVDAAPSISITAVASDSIVVAYAMPPGQLPQTNGHRLCIWQSASPSYSGRPLAVQQITSDRSTGYQVCQLMLFRGTTYTIAYVAGPRPTDIACSTSFTT
ncbi:MAG TPA: hypothetical protein VK507_23280 [Iamia sp.]|nr:hypothetical protein [Iamia sp.]